MSLLPDAWPIATSSSFAVGARARLLLLALAISCQTAKEDTVGAPSLLPEIDSLSIGPLTYLDSRSGSGLASTQVTNNGNSTLRLLESNFEGDGSSKIALLEKPNPGTDIPPGETFLIKVGVTSSLGQWSSKVFEPELVMELEVMNEFSAGCAGTTLEPSGQFYELRIPIVMDLVCDIDGDGQDASECGDGDCDDTDPQINGYSPELCDGIDNDCDGHVDNDAWDASLWYSDQDSDGYGDPEQAILDCQHVTGRVDVSGDCDDSDAKVNPDATELCDGIDNDCDSEIDEADAADAITWFADEDSDGYGNPHSTTTACEPPWGFVEDDLDCDDGDPQVNPDAFELNDGTDNNCDGDLDFIRLPRADASMLGVSPGDATGRSVSFAGDLDGDGLDDILLGAPGLSGRGGAYLVAGTSCDGSDELCGEPFDLPDSRAVFSGADEGDLCAAALSSAGDADGDGLDDVLIGAPGADLGGLDSGAVYLLYGPLSGSIGPAEASTTFWGEEAGDGAGSAVVGAGDLDLDGRADLLMGAPRASGGARAGGAVYLFLGSGPGDVSLGGADALLLGDARGGMAGFSLAAGFDVDGDGLDDFLVGAPGDGLTASQAGAAYLVPGPLPPWSTLADAGTRILGEQEGDNAGWSVAGAGDIDGDGHDDLLIGAPQAEPGGVAYLVPGSVELPYLFRRRLSGVGIRLEGESDGDQAGWSVDGAGDLDADGFNDLVIAAPGHDREAYDAGAVYVLLGPVSGTLGLGLADVVLLGDSDGDAAGSDVAGWGDLNGDASPDLLLGASADVAGSSGAAYLLLGW